MTLIERAARALFDEEWEYSPSIRWQDADDDERESWKKSARAVLHAIREPSEEMRIAGGCEGLWDSDMEAHPEHEAELVWKAMIDAALEDDTGTIKGTIKG